ncbi:hypothetical protein R1flu_020117 [Riccia fluitans]|uniref:Cystathionine beta-lyase, chloroplastic n=1 Tax=Riccia fluitans TaxID=41844 RepID=A0ABD1ZKM4_9MARC
MAILKNSVASTVATQLPPVPLSNSAQKKSLILCSATAFDRNRCILAFQPQKQHFSGIGSPRMPIRATAATSASGAEPETRVRDEQVEWSVTTQLLDGEGAEPETKLRDEAEWSVATQLLHSEGVVDNFEAMSSPLYQTATFRQPSATEGGAYDYTRSGNPTRDSLEKLLAKLDLAERAFCFTSGMAALTTVSQLCEAGDEIVVGDDIYGGSDRLLSRIVPKNGITVKRVDMSDLEDVRAAVGPKTRLVWLESPTNPRIMICDIRKIADIAHSASSKALVMVDNSIMSPILSRPLELGADIVMHSATKFISGHSDVMAGVLAVKDASLAKDIYFLQNAEGTGLAPFECWLCLRGIKTMSLRVERQQSNAQRIAEFLQNHPRVKNVNYAGLPGHPGHDLHFSQCKGAGSVLSFTTGSLAVSKHIVEATNLFSITVSFGSVSSLISLPCFMSHASIPSHIREERGLNEDLIRLSVGIEEVDDLIDDLEEALQTAPP